MNYSEQYAKWLESDFTNEDMKAELKSIENDINEIEDRFYKNLEFGTAGLRGVIGAGTNRMNVLTVGRATQGLANYLIDEYQSNISVAIAYDSRFMSKEFADTAANVLAANDIKVYLYEGLRSTPQLSFTVRQLNCNAGIVITASHNPSKYNGYKVYNNNGGQIVEAQANKITEKIEELDYNDIKVAPNEQISNVITNRNIISIGKEIDDQYIAKVKTQSLSKNLDLGINIVYTPLHGTGNIPVRRVLKEMGYRNVYTVPSQEMPDPSFSTVKLPNPENIEAFDRALEIAQKVKADIVLATDPDCDRVGVVVRDDFSGEYHALTGNQVGAILTEYILCIKDKEHSIPENAVIINSIVTSDLGEKIAAHYGVKTIKTLTGFKYIAQKVNEYSTTKEHSFILGYEESYGYLTGDFVRDKDAVIASMLIAEMSAYYKKRGRTLLNVLNELYRTYGYYTDEVASISVDGALGQSKISRIIEYFRDNKLTSIYDNNITSLYDYKLSILYDLKTGDFEKIELPKSNVLKYCFEDGSWFVIRPSGTEPKMKIYFSLLGSSKQDTIDKLNSIKNDIFAIVNCIV